MENAIRYNYLFEEECSGGFEVEYSHRFEEECSDGFKDDYSHRFEDDYSHRFEDEYSHRFEDEYSHRFEEECSDGFEDEYSHRFEEEYSDSEDEEIIYSGKIPRHLIQRTKETGFFDPQMLEDESESEEDIRMISSTKVVIRHLPPGMNGNVFFQLVSPLPAHDYKYFVEASSVSWATHVGAHALWMPCSIYLIESAVSEDSRKMFIPQHILTF